jgi:lipopolysaccharide biosynthesis regulator YciM
MRRTGFAAASGRMLAVLVLPAWGVMAAPGREAFGQTSLPADGRDRAKTVSSAALEAPRPPLPANVLIELKQGEFRKALTSLQSVGDADRAKYANEIDRLGLATALFDLADEAARQRQRSELTSLAGELTKLELPAAELAFQEGVVRARQRLLQSLRASQAPADEAALAHAKGLLANGDLEGAASAYESIARDRELHLPQVLFEADRGSEAVRRQRTPWQQRVASGISSLATLAQWIVGLFLAWVAHRGIRSWLARHPLEEPSLEITVAGQAAESSAATAQVADRLRGDSGHSRAPSIDATEDVDRSGLANINLSTEDLGLPKELASSTERISFLGLSFTPQQIHSLLQLRRPRRHEFSGTLSANDGSYRVVLRERRGGYSSWFTCEATTRAEALAETADYVAFQTASWRVSECWPSFRAYKKALRMAEALGAEESKEWSEARELLVHALAHDPQNIAARYQLGIMLRRLGRNDDAATQLARVNATFSGDSLSASLQTFAEKNPHFRGTVRYDLALCHAKQDSFGDLVTAERLLLELNRESRGQDGVSDRLAILTSGSLAAVTAGRMGLELADKPRAERDAWRKVRGRKLFDKIVALTEEIETFRTDVDRGDAAACASAMAIAMAAQGRALILLNEPEKAERALRQARAESPNLACASIHLADVLRRSNEDEEALALLQRAVALSPRNARALHLIGLIHQQRGDDETAVAFLEKARASSKSAAVDILYATSLRALGRTGEALRVLIHSIRTVKKNRVDYRYQLFLDIASRQSARSTAQVDLAELYFRQIEQHPDAVNFAKCLDYMIAMELRPVDPEESTKAEALPAAAGANGAAPTQSGH